MANIENLNLYYSGGAGNSNPALSTTAGIGNAIPSAATTISNTNPVSGIFIEDIVNAAGKTVEIQWTASNKRVRIQIDGMLSGNVTLNANLNDTWQTKVTLSVGNVVTVYGRYEGALLDPADQTVSFTVTGSASNLLFPDVLPQESLSGSTEYRLYYIRNDEVADTIQLTRIQLEQTSSLGSQWAASTGTGQAANTPIPAGILADFSTAPGYAGTKNISAINLGPLDTYWFILRRIIGASNATDNPNASMGISLRGNL